MYDFGGYGPAVINALMNIIGLSVRERAASAIQRGKSASLTAAEEAVIVAEALFVHFIPVLTVKDAPIATRILADLFPEANLGQGIFLNALKTVAPESLEVLSRIPGSTLLKVKFAQVCYYYVPSVLSVHRLVLTTATCCS